MEKRSQQDWGNPKREHKIETKKKGTIKQKIAPWGEGYFACLSHAEAEDQGKCN